MEGSVGPGVTSFPACRVLHHPGVNTSEAETRRLIKTLQGIWTHPG